MSVIYVDCETTGLDHDRHEIWELAYAVDDGPIKSGVVLHSLRHADPMALGMNGYWSRTRGVTPESCQEVETGLRNAFVPGMTLVGANPRFDAAFLRARWGVEPFHYRLLDVEAYAMGALGCEQPQGLRTVAEALRGRGFAVQHPDHSAAGDVATLRACHAALRTIYDQMRGG